MLEIGSKTRLLVGLIIIFVLINAFYFLCLWFLPAAAVPFTLGLGICIVIYFIYRWQIKPPTYDKEIQDLHGMLNLLPLLNGTFLPFGSWAMEPQSLVNLLSSIQLQKCHTIVECGSGLSTLLIAALLEQQAQGHLFSIEEDNEWYHLMVKLIRQRGLEHRVTLIHAPLTKYNGLSEAIEWYSTSEIARSLGGIAHIDLLLVDGPKSKTPLSRYPALPFFQPWIDQSTMLVLDDARRAHEQIVLERWQLEFPVTIDTDLSSAHGQARVRFTQS